MELIVGARDKQELANLDVSELLRIYSKSTSVCKLAANWPPFRRLGKLMPAGTSGVRGWVVFEVPSKSSASDLCAHDALADGVAHQAGGFVHTQLLHDAAAMRIGGLVADAQ
jgi:hypothetical protein